MRRHILLAASALVLAGASASAVPLARVEGVDDPALNAAIARIVGEAPSHSDNRWRNRERARDAGEQIRRYLDSQGYFAALIDPRLDDDQRPLVRVRPGERFTISTLDILFETPANSARPGEDIRAAAGLHTGQPMRSQDVIDAEAAVVEALRNNGWPLARAGEHVFTADHLDASVSVEMRFDTGPFLRFGRPQLAGGLADIREDYVASLAPFNAGDPVSARQLNVYTQRLQALDSVALAEARLAPEGEGSDNIRPVDVRMEPTPRHRIQLSARYATTEGAGAGAEWARRNLFRRDETLTLTGRASELNTGGEAALLFPHWRRFAQTLEIGTGVALENTDAFEQDSISARATLSRPVTDQLFASAGLSAQIARITDAAGQRTLNSVTFPVSLAYDNRDDVLDPQSGIGAELEIRPGLTFGDTESRYVRAVLGARTYFPVSERLLFAVRGRVGALFGVDAQSVPADLRFYAGGGGSVRGYGYQALSPRVIGINTGELEPFGGRSLVETSVEARWRYSQRLGFVGFVDGGVASSSIEPEFDDMRFGVGAGVRYYPGFGPLRVDIAAPLNRRPGDAPVHLYISIGQAF
ncbi:outer membrane protein assembly factor [Glycocaulis albus]|jgi:translocation and assembly module TamA|uniref:Outer membrane protein assembly factor n=1 Tax=Glycocaulis albus TaxID=1382801 RepID=A0ABQ1XJZ6_9PROT|nr:BamA/TamA family outer membrane protein [Glycocaulis albus]MBV5261387.1 BamA/TamA family outer membrane protein [Synechococcus moorigangaii CMS01]GGG95751.1 outer membrane protein assembly factor [Glycocaulis albus]